MNQYIKICYKPNWSLNSNYWFFRFRLNKKEYREKHPSSLFLSGYWDWCIRGKLQRGGKYFDWNKS